MKFNIYILLSAAFLWFVLSFLFGYRACWDKADYHVHRGKITNIGVKDIRSDKYNTMLMFELSGLPDTMGILRRNIRQYDTFSNHLHTGDTVDLYYGNWGLNDGQINTQVVHLQKNNLILVNLSDRKKSDTAIALILGGIGLGFLVLSVYMHQRNKREIKQAYTFTII